MSHQCVSCHWPVEANKGLEWGLLRSVSFHFWHKAHTHPISPDMTKNVVTGITIFQIVLLLCIGWAGDGASAAVKKWPQHTWTGHNIAMVPWCFYNHMQKSNNAERWNTSYDLCILTLLRCKQQFRRGMHLGGAQGCIKLVVAQISGNPIPHSLRSVIANMYCCYTNMEFMNHSRQRWTCEVFSRTETSLTGG